MEEKIITLSAQKKIFFASDFHLGAPNSNESLLREKKIVKWLEIIKSEAQELFILGDVFDFWYEYRYLAPKGYFRFLSKIAEFTDEGIPVTFFKGNHDMWMKEYLPKAIGVKIYDDTLDLNINNVKFQIGHGDGLGPGDYSYKILRKLFRNKIAQWFFSRVHPNFSFWVANSWSANSRLHNDDDKKHLGDKETIYQHCLSEEQKQHRDYYIFGHRHLPMEMKVGDKSKYINLGEWITDFTYGVFDGKSFNLEKFEG